MNCSDKDNPCYCFSYRLIVLRALPNLTKLDNVDVSPEEVQEALRGGVRRDDPPPAATFEPEYVEPVASPPQRQDYRQSSPMIEVQWCF